MPLAPPAPRLPPLSRLWAVALTLREGGYAGAAAVLGVTPGAVRARVRAVESVTGVPLFAPLPRGLTPTPDGTALGRALDPGFAALAAALAPLGPPPLPLNALVALETVLRVGGFAAAASELGVTASAVAGRIRVVEDWAGRALFQRHAQGVTPVPDARAIHPALAQALAGLGGALEPVARAQVRIAALPAIAQLWLAPRLPALRAALPGVTVAVTALEQAPTGKVAPYDLALFMAAHGGLMLDRDALLPVCTPDLAARLNTPADLARLPCLGDAVWARDWADWARVAGITPPQPVLHSLYALAVDEALCGAGVLMGHLPLVRRHLQSGALIAPFAIRAQRAAALRLWPLRALRGDAARVAEWLSPRDAAPQGLGEADGCDYIGRDWRQA